MLLILHPQAGFSSRYHDLYMMFAKSGTDADVRPLALFGLPICREIGIVYDPSEDGYNN